MAAIPGDDQAVTVGDIVLLDGSASDASTYCWAMVAHPPGSYTQFKNDRTATPSFVADVEGMYALLLETDHSERAAVLVVASAA